MGIINFSTINNALIKTFNKELSSEIESVDKETIRMNSLYNNEQIENDNLQKQINSISNAVGPLVIDNLIKDGEE